MHYIKLLNIFRQDKILNKKIKNKINKCISQSEFINTKNINLFEKKFKNYFSSKFCISCGNGSDAIFLVLKNLNLPKKSEVIIPAMTYVATANAVINCGLIPRITDVSSNGILHINEIIRSFNKKTKAIILVNLYGQNCLTNEIIEFCKNKKIKIIEDSAQSHGCFDCENCKNFELEECCKKKLHCSKNSDAVCYSFFPGKNLGCYGDGGAILTNNKKLFEKILTIKNNGSKNKVDYLEAGINSRLDGIQAEVLSLKLNELKKNNEKRIKIANYYYKKIINPKIKIMKQKKGSVYHQFLLFTKNRNKLKKFLHKNHIDSGIHYPYTIDNLKSFKNFRKKSFKNQNALRIANQSLSIPIDPYLTKNELKRIINTLNKY